MLVGLISLNPEPDGENRYFEVKVLMTPIKQTDGSCLPGMPLKLAIYRPRGVRSLSNLTQYMTRFNNAEVKNEMPKSPVSVLKWLHFHDRLCPNVMF